MSDQRFQQWLEDIEDAIDGDVQAKQDLDQAVYEARQEIEQRGEMIEDLANERDRYRNSVLRVKDQIEGVLEEDAEALGRLENEVRDLYTELDDLDIDPDESTYGRGFLSHEKDERQSRGNRRDFLALLAGGSGLLAAGFSGLTYFGGGSENANDQDQYGVAEGDWYGFSEVNDCLNEDQQQMLEENLEDSLDEHQYRFERSGDSRSEGWDIYVRSGQGTEEIGKLDGQDIYCEVR